MAKRKKTYILNYRVIVEPDTYTGSNKPCYTAHCPTLGVADSGETIEEALRNVRGAIECELEFLMEEGKEIPVDKTDEEIITHTQVEVYEKPNFVFA